MYNVNVRWPDGSFSKVSECKTLKETRKMIKHYFAYCYQNYAKFHHDLSKRRLLFVDEVKDEGCSILHAFYDGPDMIFSCFCNY